MFKSKIRKEDIKAILMFLLAIPTALISKQKNKDLWLVSERPGEARDNGYWLFKYIKENHKNQSVRYVIKDASPDKKNIELLGDIVSFGSYKHYVTYLLASVHASAHVDLDSPNSRVSNFLETHGFLKNKRVFLQHGITKDKISFGYYSVSRADLFVCAARPEFEFCENEFGYPKGAVKLLGFARFDGLGTCQTKRQVLLMPTWRSWLANLGETEFINSSYFKSYQSLLLNDNLKGILEEQGVTLLFYPHSDMQKFIHLFYTDSKKIHICNSSQYSVQQLLNESDFLLTDYSSVAFDMAYMGRPVCYYQFDYEHYRKEQHPDGYYSYDKHGFGPVFTREEDVVDNILELIRNNFEPKQIYIERQENFFNFRDRNNCERIYNAIREMIDDV